MRNVKSMAAAAAVTLVVVAGVLVVSPVIDGGEGFARENAIVVIVGACLFNSLYVALRVNDIDDALADATAGGSCEDQEKIHGESDRKQHGIAPR